MILPIFNQITSISESLVIANFVVASFGTKTKKQGLFYTLFLACLLYFDLYFLNINVIHNSNLIALIQIAICFLFELIFLSGSLYMKILIPLLSTILTLLINMFLIMFFSRIYHIDILNITGTVSGTSFILILFSRILYLFASYYIISIQHKNVFHLSQKEWTGVMLIYISSLCVGCSVFTINIDNGNHTNIYIVIIIIGLVMINLYSFYFIRKLSKDNAEKVKYSILELQSENQKKDVIALNQKYMEMMKLRHDFKNYILCCQTLLTEHKYDEALQYLQNLSQDKLNQSSYIRYSENNALNAILSAKANICKEKTIDLTCNITTTCDHIDEIDLSILLANLLDNAIEACDHIKTDSVITVNISNEKSYLHIQIKNTIEHSVLSKNPQLKTSKRDKINHGFGIQTITDIVKKYDGMHDFYEKDNSFVADLWLNTNNNTKGKSQICSL
ncbi:MAG: GHKL domain-containing protein [Clostridiales bacterium]|nr:GHKL domain-containing protein [Clostridiales bacterium]